MADDETKRGASPPAQGVDLAARQQLISAVMQVFPADIKPGYGETSESFAFYYTGRRAEMVQGYLSYRLGLAMGKWSEILGRIAREHGLTLGSWHALFAIAVNQPAKTMTDIAAQLGVSHAALVRVLDELERVGFIEREIDQNDRRAKLLVLTRAGEKANWALFHSLNEIRAEMLEGISLPEVELMVEITDRISANLDRMKARGR